MKRRTVVDEALARYAPPPDEPPPPQLRRPSPMLTEPPPAAWPTVLVVLLASGVFLAWALPILAGPPRALPALAPAGVVAPAPTPANCPPLDPAPADRSMIYRMRGCPQIVLVDLGATSEWRAVAPGREGEALGLQEVGP